MASRAKAAVGRRKVSIWLWIGASSLAPAAMAVALASGSCSATSDPTTANPVKPDSGKLFDPGDAGADVVDAPVESGDCPLSACAPHFADCDRDAADGCEANLNANIDNCGACGNVCGDAGPDGAPLPFNAVPYCADGGCDWYCAPDPNFGPVYKKCDDNCIYYLCDVNNCGDCDVVCPPDELGNKVCNVGTCGCPFGTVDCDGIPECGQECKDLNHDAMNCGECGRACPQDPALFPFNETYTCDGPNPDGGLPDCIKVCVTQPYNLWLDCNHDMEDAPASGDGCETFGWGSTTDCGACGNACLPGEVCHPINATSIEQECGCAPPLTYCPAAPYCRNLQSDPYNCGACFNVCPAPPHAMPTCVDGMCGFACNFGFADCNQDPEDGCEIDTLNNPDNCGGCTNDCDAGTGCGKICEKENGEYVQTCQNGVCATTECGPPK